MSISASMVRDLREKTSAGMMDCKRALQETNGDFDAAVEWLRVKGLASAAKKADRLASEGLVSACVSKSKVGVLIEVNSETDFVAKNDVFKQFVANLANHLATTTSKLTDVPALLQAAINGIKVEERLKEIIAKIGENLVVRRFVRFEAPGYIHSYVHGDGKIGVLVELSTEKQSEVAKTFANDLCLHVAAMNPISLSMEEVPADIVAKEKEILKAKNIEQGKKPEMIDKIVDGQIKKFLAESCLLEQAFVKNPEIKVKEHLAQTIKSLGENFMIKRFCRFELGEGLQKRSTDFAAEVAAQTSGH